MSKTVVGLFSTIAQAEQVKQALISDGYESKHVKVVANEDDMTTGSSTNYDSHANAGTGIGEKISNFFHSLAGGDDTVHNHYAAGVNAGGALVAVTVEDNQATEVASVLKQHGARDIDGEYDQAASSRSPVYGAGNASQTDATAIPVVEEELVVEKREVDRGGVRVYSHVTERPVEENVTLREEHINVERRPVNRPATAADFEAGRGSVIEMLAKSEEAVVGKTSRVVEEVLVGKSTTERTEAIHDTVRKTEVDVEDLADTKVQKDRY